MQPVIDDPAMQPTPASSTADSVNNAAFAASSSRPVASVSLDVDNLWSYMKIHGDAGWESRPSYLDTFVPHTINLLARLGLKITFFVVGRDAADPANGPALRHLVEAGHEVGNHSHEHEPWLHRYSVAQLHDEIRLAGDAIEAATGTKPTGFRGPGFSWSPDLLRVLVEQGYRYDASTLPTWLGPIARAYYFRTSGLSREERKVRSELFGSWADVMRPIKPYRWNLGEQHASLLEIPVTTMPLFRTPFHFSYLAYLSRVSEPLMFAYLQTALTLCRLTGTSPSFLLHPLDVIGADKAPQLKFFPGMDISSERKSELLARVLAAIGRQYQIVTMGEHAARLEQGRQLALRTPA